MDEALKVKLIGYLDAIEGAVESGSAFVASEMPLVAWELVAYHRAVSTVYLVVGLVFMALPMELWNSVNEEWNKPAREANPVTAIVGGAAVLVLPFIGLFMVSINLSTCLKAWFAPRLLILEELAKLL